MTIEKIQGSAKGEILVVEDNIFNLEYLSAILKQNGYLVRAANNGELALRSIDTKLPDLVLLDIQMPGIDGIEVCKRLKQNEATSEIPVIFISAQYDAAVKVKALEVGGADCVTKPFQPFEILARIKTHILMARNAAALKANEERFRCIVESSPIAKYIYHLENDDRLILVGANPSADRIIGFSHQDLIGKTLEEAFPQLVQTNLPSIYRKIAKGLLGNQTFEIPYKDERICGYYNVTVFQVGANQIVVDFIDITDRKNAEEEHRKYEQKLQQSQKLESLGVLAGGIAHDFNNLLGAIYGYIDLAGEGATDGNLSRYLSKAMNTIERARALTQQLVTFSKGGSPKQEVGYLFPFVEETAKFALSGANVSCNCVTQQDLWACNFDKNQIGQVIDNLIINAQQAMPLGGVIELTARNITLAEKEHPLLALGNYIKISVKDSGTGIPQEHISKIFDPFFTTKAMGHGLGLATCYSIINRHGGCIDVESEPRKGSTFKVYLPASTEAASSAIKEISKTHNGSGTFLIMDDEEVMRDAIGEMLGTLGYAVVSKENGKEAVDFFASETKANRKITGMIFDLTVPGGMGGKAAIKEIRKINTEVPAFVASGYADDAVMKNPAKHGFTASICKPFRKSELSEMLNKYIQS